MTEELLKVENIKSGYGDLTVLFDVSLYVRKGERVGILGPNGAGKTTLINTIIGIADIKAGKVFFNGEDITKLPPHKKVEKGIVVIPEGRRLFPKMTVLENLRTAALTTVKAKRNYEKNLDFVFSLFPRLKERLNQKSSTLSGGEQQMLAIARGLMMEPLIMLLDEPSQGLAPILVEKVYEALDEMSKRGVTIFIVEQHIAQILDFADRIYLIDRGKIVSEGPPKKIREKLIKTYLI